MLIPNLKSFYSFVFSRSALFPTRPFVTSLVQREKIDSERQRYVAPTSRRYEKDSKARDGRNYPLIISCSLFGVGFLAYNSYLLIYEYPT
ncbi:hypothetical protein HK096_000468, partial [Nowakowskiella sp. JEL0078]